MSPFESIVWPRSPSTSMIRPAGTKARQAADRRAPARCGARPPSASPCRAGVLANLRASRSASAVMIIAPCARPACPQRFPADGKSLSGPLRHAAWIARSITRSAMFGATTLDLGAISDWAPLFPTVSGKRCRRRLARVTRLLRIARCGGVISFFTARVKTEGGAMRAAGAR